MSILRQIHEDLSMSHRANRRYCTTAAMLVVLACAGRADAGLQLINNGDFEPGLSGWTTAVQPGSDGGWFSQAGTTSPLTNSPVQPPPGPTHAAMSDGFRGSQVLYQDFFVPQGGFSAATLSFDLAIANEGRGALPMPFNPLSTLDYTVDGNRQARVDILVAGSDPFSVAAGDVLLNLFTTQPTDPNLSGYTASTADLTALLDAHEGQTLRLRFAEVNSQPTIRAGVLNFGVDLVGLDVTLVPEPTSLALLAFGVLGLASYACRRMRAGASSVSEGSPGPAASPEIGP